MDKHTQLMEKVFIELVKECLLCEIYDYNGSHPLDDGKPKPITGGYRPKKVAMTPEEEAEASLQSRFLNHQEDQYKIRSGSDAEGEADVRAIANKKIRDEKDKHEALLLSQRPERDARDARDAKRRQEEHEKSLFIGRELTRIERKPHSSWTDEEKAFMREQDNNSRGTYDW